MFFVRALRLWMALCVIGALLATAGCRLEPAIPDDVGMPTPVKTFRTATPLAAVATPTPARIKPTNTLVVPLPTHTPSRAQIEAAVQDAVERFQKAKEYSQKTNDASRLSQDLAGQALERQIELVEQTKAQNCYWDIWLDTPMTYEFLEIRDYVRVRVRAAKTETRHKYCDGQYSASESVDRDTYTTTYVVEQINGKWYVTQRD